MFRTELLVFNKTLGLGKQQPEPSMTKHPSKFTKKPKSLAVCRNW